MSTIEHVTIYLIDGDMIAVASLDSTRLAEALT